MKTPKDDTLDFRVETVIGRKWVRVSAWVPMDVAGDMMRLVDEWSAAAAVEAQSAEEEALT